MKVLTTLKRAHFGNRLCAFSPSFVSDGHWALKKERIANAALFANEQTIMSAFPTLDRAKEMTDEMMQQQFGIVEKLVAGKSHNWVDTRVSVNTFNAGKDVLARLYVGAGGVITVFDSKYLDLFDIGSDDSATGSDDPRKPMIFGECLLLMPFDIATALERFTPLLPALEKLVTDGKRFSTEHERKQNLQVAANRLTSALQAVNQQLDELSTKKAA